MDTSQATEERCEAIRARIASEPRYQRVLYRILDDCRAAAAYGELERRIQAYPEMAAAMFEPATLVAWLCDCEALVMLPEDYEAARAGEAAPSATDAAQEGPAPEIWLQLGKAGEAVLDEYQRQDLLGHLLDSYPARREAFEKVLAFCETPKTKEDIQACLEQAGLYNPQEALVNFYLDKLEQAGALVWSGGWQTVALR